jgi:type III secretory pathway component EscT
MPSIIGSVTEALSAQGVDLTAVGMAWARAMPTVTLVPAFGLRALPAPALPAPARMVMGLAFAACIFPAMPPPDPSSSFWVLMLLNEVVRGLPVAIATAVPLWAATMAGGVVDTLRGSQATASAPTVEGQVTPMGVPLSLLACGIFLRTGGPSRLVRALALHPVGTHPVVALAQDIANGVTLSVGLAAPLVAASIVVEVATSLIARAASPAQVHALLAPLRAMGILATLAIVLERLAGMLTRVIEDVPG